MRRVELEGAKLVGIVDAPENGEKSMGWELADIG